MSNPNRIRAVTVCTLRQRTRAPSRGNHLQFRLPHRNSPHQSVNNRQSALPLLSERGGRVLLQTDRGFVGVLAQQHRETAFSLGLRVNRATRSISLGFFRSRELTSAPAPGASSHETLRGKCTTRIFRALSYSSFLSRE